MNGKKTTDVVQSTRAKKNCRIRSTMLLSSPATYAVVFQKNARKRHAKLPIPKMQYMTPLLLSFPGANTLQSVTIRGPMLAIWIMMDKYEGSFQPSGRPSVIIAGSSTHKPFMSTHDPMPKMITVAYTITSIFLNLNTLLFLSEFSVCGTLVWKKKQCHLFITLILNTSKCCTAVLI